MFTISKETYEIMREKCDNPHQQAAAGQFVQSKLTNRLLWTGGIDTDPVRDVIIMLNSLSPTTSFGTPDSSGQSTSSCSSLSSEQWPSCAQLSMSPTSDSGSQVHDKKSMSETWEILRAINDECDFCQKLPAKRRHNPKHTLFDANGELSCPIALAGFCNGCGGKEHTLEYCTSGGQSSAKDRNQYASFKTRNAGDQHNRKNKFKRSL